MKFELDEKLELPWNRSNSFKINDHVMFKLYLCSKSVTSTAGTGVLCAGTGVLCRKKLNLT